MDQGKGYEYPSNTELAAGTEEKSKVGDLSPATRLLLPYVQFPLHTLVSLQHLRALFKVLMFDT